MQSWKRNFYNNPESKITMTDNVFDFATMRTVEGLARHIGSIEECKRLGFIHTDDKGVMGLSVAGLGYCIWVRARNVTSIAEAFAAGYQCAHDEMES